MPTKAADKFNFLTVVTSKSHSDADFIDFDDLEIVEDAPVWYIANVWPTHNRVHRDNPRVRFCSGFSGLFLPEGAKIGYLVELLDGKGGRIASCEAESADGSFTVSFGRRLEYAGGGTLAVTVKDKRDGKVYLIDEVHTPDSSRYFYAEGYEEKFEKGEPQKQLSKEFVRQWLIDHNFMNQPGQVMPEITDEYAESVSDRYIELYEHIIGEKFVKETSDEDLAKRIERNVNTYLASK